MGFQKTRDAKPEDPSIEDLEKRFAQLSIKAEEQGSFKGKQSNKQSPGPNPFLKRRATADEVISGIDKLQDLCREVQDMCDPYIKAEERMEKEEFVRALNCVLNHLD